METPTEPIAPTPHSKIGLIAVSIGLLLIGLVAGYFVGKNEIDPIVEQTATPIATENLQTYRNEEYGFEIEYPADWFTNEYVLSGTDRPDRPRYYQKSVGIGKDYEPLSLDISIFQNPQKLSLESWVTAEYSSQNRKWYSVSPTTPFSVHGIKGVRFKVSELGSAVMTAFSDHDFIIVFGYDFYPENTHAMLDQVISTFRFIK